MNRKIRKDTGRGLLPNMPCETMMPGRMRIKTSGKDEAAKHIIRRSGTAVDFRSGMPIGNGDFGASMHGTPDNLTFNIAKNVLWWDDYDAPEPCYPDGGIEAIRKKVADGDAGVKLDMFRAANRRSNHPVQTSAARLTLHLLSGGFGYNIREELDISNGTAKQYFSCDNVNGSVNGRDYCVDNWFMMTNPGHSAEEMYYNLLFAYLAGVDCAYVESVMVMADGDGKLTEHGEQFRRFCNEYKGKDRGYSIKDYRPEIGIIRYDDGFWGQWYPIIFKKCLFGNPKIKPDYRSKEIFRVFNILTHGETCKNGISWGRFSPWLIKNHRHFSFVSLNSTAVFDHNADRKVLDSLKLCFLCGIHIPDNTLKEVRDCVRENGMTAVTTKRFAPADIILQASGKISEVKDGKGKWIVIKSYRTGKLKEHIKEFIGNKGEMRLSFEDREIIMKINKDRDSFSVCK